VRLGPADTYAIVGMVPRNAILEIVGRNETGDWLAIVFTPGSQFRGWVPKASVVNLTDVSRLPVVSLTPLRPR
jgi:hypothetical protein